MCTDARGRLHECPRPVSQMPEAGCTNARGRYHIVPGPVSRCFRAGILAPAGSCWPRRDGGAIQVQPVFDFYIGLRVSTICRYPKNDMQQPKKRFSEGKKIKRWHRFKNIYLATKIFSSHEWQQQMMQSIHFIAFCNV